MLLEKAIELALKCHRTDSNQGLLDKLQQLQFANQRHKILNWDYLLLQLLVIAICGLCYCLSCLWTCLLNLKCNLQQNMTKIAKTPANSDLFSSYGHIITRQVWLDSMLNSSYQNRDVACGVIASFKYACMAKFSCFFVFFLPYNGDRYIGTTVLFVTFDPVSSWMRTIGNIWWDMNFFIHGCLS